MVLLNPCDDGIEKIEKKISQIKSICGGCNLAIALDPFNLSRLENLTALALKHSCHLRTNRLYDGGSIPGYIEKYESSMRRMFELLLDAEKPVWPNWIMESTYPTWVGPKNPYSCGRWFAAIDPDGTIRSCNPDKATVIGSISDFPLWENLRFHQRWSAKNLPECEGCDWVVWCQGGCPYTRKLTWGTYGRKTPFCQAFKNLFPLLMQLKERWVVCQIGRRVATDSQETAKQAPL